MLIFLPNIFAAITKLSEDRIEIYASLLESSPWQGLTKTVKEIRQIEIHENTPIFFCRRSLIKKFVKI